MTRLLCTRCGDSVHADTAARNAGLCTPCLDGNQLSIEERRARRAKEQEDERARLSSPEFVYWSGLVKRVFKTPDGFDGLGRGDQLYYLVNTLGGEVCNGGFEQFFSNSAGNRYAQTVAALAEVGDQDTLYLLQQAKQILFGDTAVPVNQAARWHLMPTQSDDHPRLHAVLEALNTLDSRFHAHGARHAALIERLAAEHRLFDAEGRDLHPARSPSSDRA